MAHKLKVIEDGTLLAMANNDLFIKEFPFLKGVKAMPKPGCGLCGGGARNKQRLQTLLAAKQTIAGLASDRKQVLKKLLDAQQVRVIYRQHSGKVVQLTF